MRRTKADNKSTVSKKLSSRRGMTMAEMLITVAIIIVLAGLAFLSLAAYQRMLEQKKRDGYAKEIYFAAQNHLAMARGEGYMQVTEAADKSSDANVKKQVYGETDVDYSDVRYFVVNGNIKEDPSSLLDVMLPFGSVDENIRAGSYILAYQPKTGMVLDVYYCSPGTGKFDHTLETGDYAAVKALRDEYNADGTVKTDNKLARRSCTLGGKDGVILGWYNGADAADLGEGIRTPQIKVVNGDSLYVRVKFNNIEKGKNTAIEGYSVRLLITGTTPAVDGSKKYAKRAIDLVVNGGSQASDNVTGKRICSWSEVTDSKDGSLTFVLDDITAVSGNTSGNTGYHFADLNYVGKSNGTDLIAGEDIKIEAVAYTNSALCNIGYSNAVKTNSLYQRVSEKKTGTNTTDTIAYIGSIRHLENLDDRVSGIDSGKIGIKSAKQTRDLNWNTFRSVLNSAAVSGIYAYNSTSKHNDFYPVTPLSTLDEYDGMRHSISNVTVTSGASSDDKAAGIFGTIDNGKKISNIEVIDPSISGSGDCGALAGAVSNGTVKNVIVYNTSGFDVLRAPTIDSDGGNAGGLIGKLSSGSISYCGAALVVDASGNAGGLIGSSTGGTVSQCFSGGHTENGEYYKHDNKGYRDTSDPIFNITAGAAAGGLIGSAGSTEITNSYSTCSAKGSVGSNTGGFVGTASGGKYTNCYCTGLAAYGLGFDTDNDPVNTAADAVNNAFIGTGGSVAGTSSGLHYLRITNEYKIKNDNEAKYKTGGTEKAGPIDESASTFNDLTGGNWNEAKPYDSSLGYRNSGSNTVRYSFVTVTQLKKAKNGTTKDYSYENSNTGLNAYFVNTHYGDWPSPEVFVIND